MILLHFNKEDFKNCTTVKEVFEAMGIGPDGKYDFTDEKVFGKEASYYNMVMHKDTFEYIGDIMKKASGISSRRTRTEYGVEYLKWVNYAPIVTGARVTLLKEVVGELNPNVLYIITPEDSLYLEK